MYANWRISSLPFSFLVALFGMRLPLGAMLHRLIYTFLRAIYCLQGSFYG